MVSNFPVVSSMGCPVTNPFPRLDACRTAFPRDVHVIRRSESFMCFICLISSARARASCSSTKYSETARVSCMSSFCCARENLATSLPRSPPSLPSSSSAISSSLYFSKSMYGDPHAVVTWKTGWEMMRS